MHLQLAPGESPAAGTLDAARRALEDPRVGAALVPLRPAGDSRLARAAARYLDAWDARYVHDNTVYAPAARVVALRDAGVRSPLAADLDAWVAWARREGEAWGRLARRDARFEGFSPARSWAGWAKHNVLHVDRRAGEVAQALRRLDPAATWLHVLREAAWTGGYVRARRQQQL